MKTLFSIRRLPVKNLPGRAGLLPAYKLQKLPSSELGTGLGNLRLSLCLLLGTFIMLWVSGCATKKEPVEQPRTTTESSSIPLAPSGQPSAQSGSQSPSYQSIELQSDDPEVYVVKKGDTLWDIAKHFLKKPWYWPEIWHVNPEIKNPHLIYPGDRLSLYYVDGKPRIGRASGMYKLSPSVRTSDLGGDAGIPIQTLRPFLIRPQVISEEDFNSAPHLLDSQDRRLIYATNDEVYVRNLPNQQLGERYSVFRPRGKLYDPVTQELLGYHAIHGSEAEVIRVGEPSTVVLLDATREVMRGDRLLPLDPGPEGMYFVPRAPAADTRGVIISLFDALSQIANYQITVINQGTRNGLEPGHVLAVHQAGRTVVDRYHAEDQARKIKLPDERSGLMMVFRSFEKISYGIILESERPMRIGDTVTAP